MAKSFGFSVPPKVHLAMESTKARRNRGGAAGPKAGSAWQSTSGHAFSAQNPYGKREAGDARQFAH